MQNKNKQIAYRTSAVTLLVNIFLSLFKFFAGVFAGSGAMISDAVHSASDAGSTIVVMFSVKISSKKADKKHQYGHEKFECIGAVILSAMLLATGFGIGYDGVMKILSGEELQTPGMLALIAAISSIAVKEGMYWYTRAAAKRINSAVLLADAWHHRSDSLSSIGSLIGISGAILGVKMLDPIAQVVIAVLIAKVSVDIAKNAFTQMVDAAADDETVESIKKDAISVNGVERIDLLQTRLHGNMLYVDIEIAVDGELNLYMAHEISQKVHDILESNNSNIKHCMVHVNPYMVRKDGVG